MSEDEYANHLRERYEIAYHRALSAGVPLSDAHNSGMLALRLRHQEYMRELDEAHRQKIAELDAAIRRAMIVCLSLVLTASVLLSVLSGRGH